MDQFQRDFFFIRQAEYKTYVDSLGVELVQQGDLTNPNYFDFISFAQYATISRDLSGNLPLIFEEQQPIETENIDNNDNEPQRFQNVIVRRSTDLKNSDLPSAHDRMVGTAILDYLNAVFNGTASALPYIESYSMPPATVMIASVKQLMNLFIINGFAWEGDVTTSTMGSGISASGIEMQVKLVSPATLWSSQSLRGQNALAVNDFFTKTVRVLLNRAGYNMKKISVKYTKSEEILTFSII